MYVTTRQFIASARAFIVAAPGIPVKLKPIPLLTALLLCSSPAVTAADTIADSYTCTLAEERREVSLAFLNQIDSVPCEIRQSKNKAPATTLWRAEHDSTFCPGQFQQYRSKMQNLGWTCTSITGNNKTTTESIKPTTAASSESIDTEVPASQELLTDPQVTLMENTGNLPSSALLAEAPRGKYGKLTAESIREMDDWLIYLSAQTMASIQQIVSDDVSFRKYQVTEQLNSENIYERLQNRVEFLHQLLSPSTPARLTGINDIDF